MATRYMGRVLNTQPMDRLGTNTAVFHISASLSISVGDTYVIGKLPNRAIITDAVFYPQGQVEAKFGTSASLSLFFGSATYVAGAYWNSKNLGPALQISLSDDAAVRYENVVMVANLGLSTGYIGDLIVNYVMPGQGL
jgi:hypothetical protein